MKEHVQECPVNGMPIHMSDLDQYYGRYECQCEILRACEQRVRDEYATWHPSVVHHCCVDVQTEYARGLDAAREAVAALPCAAGRGQDRKPRHVDDFKDSALAAIDALKEKP